MKAYYISPVGILELVENDNHLCSLSVVEKEGESQTSPLLSKVMQQLDEYFAGKRTEFDLPLKQDGTEFQQKSWRYLQSIPYGQTVSYKQQSEGMTSSVNACRAVGSANGKNHIAIIVPCHRVINSNGGMGGYAYGLEVKTKLLELEKKYKK